MSETNEEELPCYTVVISVGNAIIHIFGYIKDKIISCNIGSRCILRNTSWVKWDTAFSLFNQNLGIVNLRTILVNKNMA